MLIHELINSNAQISLLPRPRRFGKTLNLSMLRYFFENREDNGYLFKELEIYKRDEFREHQGKYPVIFLTFKDVKSDNKEEALNKIYSLIREEFGRHKKSILDIVDDLDDEDKYNYWFLLKKGG